MSNLAFILPKTERGAIQRSHDIGRVVAELEALPEEESWRVKIESVKSERSLKQNKYLFGVAYKLLSDAIGMEKHELHDDLLKAHFGVRLRQIRKTKFNPRGLEEVPMRTTTTDEKGRRSVISKIKFMDFVAFVQRFGAEIDVVIPDPDSTLAKEILEAQAK